MCDMEGIKAHDDLRKMFTPRSTVSTRFGGTESGKTHNDLLNTVSPRCGLSTGFGSTFGGHDSLRNDDFTRPFRRPASRVSDHSNTVSPRFLRGLRLPPMEHNPAEEDRGMMHLREELPSKYFLDDERYSRRAVLEENVIDAEVLKHIDFFRNFGPDFLDELLSADEGIRKVVMMPNTVLVREGAPGDSMMVISKGKVAVSIKGRCLKHLDEGSYFGELVFFGAAKFRTATVTTLTFCDVRIIYSKTFKQVAAKYPAVLAALAKFDSRMNDTKGSAKRKAQTGKDLAGTLAGIFRSLNKCIKNNQL